MKRTFLKFLPIAAAILLATSCSKDNDGDNSVAPAPVETQNIASPTESSPSESKSVPFSIKVAGGGSLSKIAYADNGSTVTTKFEESDKGKVVLLVASTDVHIDLELTEVDAEGVATFEADLGKKTEPTKGTGMTAILYYNEKSEETTSTTSLPDLMKRCAHQYTGTFYYKETDKVMLTDNNAYIEIIMSPLQKDIDLTIGDTPQTFAMKDGKVWIAVANGTTFTTNFTAEKTCTAGQITTINRSGFVDVGIPGILWADRNLGAAEVYDYGNYYAWGEVAIKDDYSWDSYSYGRDKEGNETHAMVNKYCPTDKTDYWDGDGSPDGKTTLEPADNVATVTNAKWTMPTQSDFAALKNNCYWVWVTNYNSKSGYIVYKTKDYAHKGGVKFADDGKEGSVDYTSSYSVDDATHIFLPAAGYCFGTSLNNEVPYGYYWTLSSYYEYPRNGLVLNFSSDYVNPYQWDSRCCGRSVRAVRK